MQIQTGVPTLSLVLGVLLAGQSSAQDCTTSAGTTDSVVDRSVGAAIGGTLALDLGTGGSVSVRGWDERRVRVRAVLGGRDWRKSRIDLLGKAGDARLQTQLCGPANSTSTSHRFEVWVPREFGVEVDSRGGSIEITDVRGVFRGSTRGGDIVLTRVRGEAELATRGGNVTIDDSHLEGNVTTRGGAVTRSRVRGGVRTGGPEHAPVSTRSSRLDVSSAGGPIALEVASDGANLTTGGGAIRVGYAEGSLAAQTGAGDIEIRASNGSVRAVTGYGDVRVGVLSLSDTQTVDVHSGWGKVIIVLPADFGGTVDLQTGFTESYGRIARITSDWKLERSTTPGFVANGGTPQRYVRASGALGSGKAHVRVRTTNGDIELRRKP